MDEIDPDDLQVIQIPAAQDDNLKIDTTLEVPQSNNQTVFKLVRQLRDVNGPLNLLGDFFKKNQPIEFSKITVRALRYLYDFVFYCSF